MSAYAKLTRAMAIETRDLLYMPSCDIAADLAFYRDVLGARVLSVHEAMGTEVAEVETSPHGPRLALAVHPGEAKPLLLRRTNDLETTLADLKARGLEPSDRVELPLGPSVTFRSPGGQGFALYQLTRAGISA